MKKNDVHRLERFNDLELKISSVKRFIHTLARYTFANDLIDKIKSPSILDIGCGNNNFFKYLNKKADIHLIDKYKKYNLNNFTKIDFLKYQTNKKFHLITFFDTLGYISRENDLEMILKAMNLLKKNGLCCISIVNYSGHKPPKYYKKYYELKDIKILKKKLSKNYLVDTFFQNYPIYFQTKIRRKNKDNFIILVLRKK